MKHLSFLYFSTLLFTNVANAQSKVASYFAGKYGTSAYEHFSFWIENGKRTDIQYSYGSHPKEMKLAWLAPAVLNGKRCFKVQFPNKYILYIIPTNTALEVKDESGKYSKTFLWEYEGPVNGIGTFCDVCAEDQDAAMKIIKENYLNIK